MLGKAEAALRGESAVPVSGSRTFLEMDESAWAEFAYSHYAMFGFEKEEDGTELWGLRQALYWFRGSAEERVEFYGFSGGEALQDGEGRKSEKEPEFFFEKKKKDYLLFSEEEWESIRKRIGQPGSAGAQYDKIRVIADEGEILFSLPILAKNVSLTLKDEGRGRVYVLGTVYYGVDFELTAHRPVRKAWIEYGRVTPMHPGKESMIPYLRLTADAKAGFDCLIRGKT